MIKKNYFLTNMIDNLDLKSKRVLLRADLNVPLQKTQIICDYKLQAILPTINLLLSKGAKIILATHLGRPKGYDPKLSTKVLLPFFIKHKYSILFECDYNQAKKTSLEKQFDILLLENIRFFPGESCKSQESQEFAKTLASLGDYYVNDAFGVLHRHDTSITLVPQLFSKVKRFLGPLVQHELATLAQLIKNPKRPFTIVLGGGKVNTKIPIIEKLLDNLPNLDTILLCPAIVFTFLKYMNKEVGNSLVSDTLVQIIPKILEKAKKRGIKLVYPVDYIIAKDSFEGPISYSNTNEIPQNFVGVSIGPKTTELFSQIITESKTIFSNGTLGDITRKETLEGMKQLFKAMAKKQKCSIIAGGDSVAAAYMFSIAKKIQYLSTGGGASLAFISGQELPGLTLFIKQS